MKKLLGLFSLFLALNASALHIPVVSFQQNNWTYTLTVDPIIGVDGEYAFTLLIDDIAVFAGLDGISGSSTTALLPAVQTPNDWYLSVGPHTVKLTYSEEDGDLVTAVGAGYTVLQPTGDRPTTTVPDAGSTIALLASGLLFIGAACLRSDSRDL
jgi:hypothetical protein